MLPIGAAPRRSRDHSAGIRRDGPLGVALSLTMIALVIAPSLPAQEGSAADAEEFARGLAHFNYYDLAEEVIEKALGAATTAGDKARLEFVRASLRGESGGRTSDRTARLQNLKAAAESFEAFLKANPTSPDASSVRFRIAEAYLNAGQAVVDLLKTEPDAAKKEGLRKDGLNLFNKALQQTEGRIADLKLITSPTEAEEAELRALQFAVGKLHFSMAMVYENRNGTLAQQSLGRAKEIFEEFEIDYPDSLLVFEANRMLVALLVEEGKLQEAQDILDQDVDKLRAALSGEGKADIINDEAVCSTIATTYLEKAKFHLSAKKPPEAQEAIKCLEEVDTLLPNLIETADGKQALGLLVTTCFTEGMPDKARKVAERVVAGDPTGSAGFSAREILDKLQTSSNDGSGITKMLEAAVSRRDIASSENMARRIFARMGDAAAAEEIADALYLIGSLYFDTGRPVEAAVCFNTIGEEYPTSKRASAAKFDEARSYAQARALEKGSPSRFWEHRKDAALAELNKRFPDSEEARAASFLLAKTAKDEGRFKDAVELYAKVPAGTLRFGEAQLEAGTLLLTLAIEASSRNLAEDAKKYLAKAEEHLLKARDEFNILATKTINDAEIRRNKDQAFLAQIRLAGIYLQPQVKKPEKCITMLADAEKDVKDQREKIAKVWSLRIKAYIQMKKGTEAAQLLEQVTKEAKATGAAGAIADAAVGIAAAMDEEAFEKDKAKPNDPEAIQLWKDAAKYYRLAAEDAKRGAPSNRKAFESVGTRLLTIAARFMSLPDGIPFIAIDPDTKLADKESIERAADAFAIAARDDSGTEIHIERERSIARCFALLGNWSSARERLEVIANAYPLIKESKLDRELMKSVPHLAAIFQDLGVAYLWSAKEETAKKSPETAKFYFVKANDFFNVLIANSERDGQMNWECRYLNLLAFYHAEDFTKLGVALDSLERTSPELDKNKYGIKNRILKLKQVAGSKIVNK